MRWSRDTFLIKLQLYSNTSVTVKKLIFNLQKYVKKGNMGQFMKTIAMLVTPMFQIINKSMKNSELCPLSGKKINEVYKHLMLG